MPTTCSRDYRRSIAFLESLLTLEPERRLSKVDSRLPTGVVGLKRCRALLERIGNPGRGLPFVHVTGTSGKGSVVSMVHAILGKAGLKSGAYMSPHVTSTLERILIGSSTVPQEVWMGGLARLKTVIEEDYLSGPYGVPSYHELLFAIALLAFEQEQVSFGVLEVGIGGTLDTTNVMGPPLVAVITDIGFDHEGLLGNELEQIATDKAGIIKRGTGVALTGTRNEAPRHAIEARAREVEVPLWRVGQEIRFRGTRSAFDVQWPGGGATGLSTRLEGPHQLRNAVLATAAVGALQQQGPPILESAMREGLRAAFLPGRFEVLSLPEGGTVVLDIAHNVDKIESLVQAYQLRFGAGEVALVAISASKNVEQILRLMAEAFRKLYLTRPLSIPRAMASPREMARLAKEMGAALEIKLDPVDALQEALGCTSRPVVVTGSTYLVGEIRRWLLPDELPSQEPGVV